MRDVTVLCLFTQVTHFKFLQNIGQTWVSTVHIIQSLIFCYHLILGGVTFDPEPLLIKTVREASFRVAKSPYSMLLQSGRKTQRNQTRMCKEHVKPHTDNNLNSGWNKQPCSCVCYLRQQRHMLLHSANIGIYHGKMTVCCCF